MPTDFAYLDADISTLLERAPWFADDLDCMITCVDSSRDVAKVLEGVLNERRARVHGRFMVLAGSDLVTSHSHVLVGFDEVYLFPRDVWRRTEPSIWQRTFTSEQCQFQRGVPSELLRIMKASGALRYASDGCGLNVAAESSNVLQNLRHSLGL